MAGQIPNDSQFICQTPMACLYITLCVYVLSVHLFFKDAEPRGN